MAGEKIIYRLYGSQVIDSNTVQVQIDVQMSSPVDVGTSNPFLGGAPRSGYFAVTPLPIVNERDLADDIRSALAGELSLRYAPENYRPRDIVLAGL